MWSHLANLRASGGSFHEHYNPFYDPVNHNGALLPPAAALAPTLWPQFFLRWTCPIESQGGDLESQWHAMNKKYADTMKVIIYSIAFYLFCCDHFIVVHKAIYYLLNLVVVWKLLLNKIEGQSKFLVEA
jgi:hypothetical protein